MNNKKRLMLWGVAMLLLVSAAAVAAISPQQTVKNAIDEVLNILADPKLDAQNRDRAVRKKIHQIVDERFDFRSMSQSVLATNWQKATAYERDRFVDFFAQSLENTYVGAIESYTGEQIKYTGEKIRGDRAVVDTVIVSKKGEIPVSYKMKLDNDVWRAYDVVIEQVSLINNYRTLYANIIKSEGVNGLLDRLEGKLEKYRQKKGKGRQNQAAK